MQPCFCIHAAISITNKQTVEIQVQILILKTPAVTSPTEELVYVDVDESEQNKKRKETLKCSINFKAI